MKIKIKSSEYLPVQGREGDAGYDLKCTEDVHLGPGSSAIVGTGVSFEIPSGYYGLLTHRSSLAFKSGTVLSLGVIDSNFTGEVRAYLFNLGKEELYLDKGDRFCQIIFNRYYTDSFELEEELGDGKEGFGSSGE